MNIPHWGHLPKDTKYCTRELTNFELKKATGEAPNLQLTDEQVREIYMLKYTGHTHRHVAKKMNCSPTTVGAIWRRETRADATEGMDEHMCGHRFIDVGKL